ncbi:MAG TPA: hypothetical protein PKY77_18750 [Phycisphaerae bacterium]|nr:hypothetical protein [Phycisphaerae bacterium]HRY66381.1 hypothetical protein [Phycisphaerae bacterium]HSA25912.1 hypothetical protein [Phycisphaerae bacterium]
MAWEQTAVLVGILSPLVGTPLAMITLYLRAIRDQQASGISMLTRRIQTMESAIHELVRSAADFEREYTTKEEWVRESMYARQRLERLTELATRIQVELENGHGVAAQIGRMAAAMTDVAAACRQMTGVEVESEGSGETTGESCGAFREGGSDER